MHGNRHLSKLASPYKRKGLKLQQQTKSKNPHTCEHGHLQAYTRSFLQAHIYSLHGHLSNHIHNHLFKLPSYTKESIYKYKHKPKPPTHANMVIYKHTHSHFFKCIYIYTLHGHLSNRIHSHLFKLPCYTKESTYT